MADDRTAFNAKDFPKTPQNDSSFLSAEDNLLQEARRDAASYAPRSDAPPGRKPLFRN